VFWSRRFEEPIELPDGRKLKPLAEAMAWLAKEIPKSEHKMEKVQTAAHLVTRAAEHAGPMIHLIGAGIGLSLGLRNHTLLKPLRMDHARQKYRAFPSSTVLSVVHGRCTAVSFFVL
jgi:hypothetical protein